MRHLTLHIALLHSHLALEFSSLMGAGTYDSVKWFDLHFGTQVGRGSCSEKRGCWGSAMIFAACFIIICFMAACLSRLCGLIFFLPYYLPSCFVHAGKPAFCSVTKPCCGSVSAALWDWPVETPAWSGCSVCGNSRQMGAKLPSS